MAFDKITEYSTTAASNTSVGGVNIAESCPPGNVNNMGREIMSHLAETNAGTYPVDDTWSFCDPADKTKIARIDCVNITTATTRVLTVPDLSGTFALTSGAQTFTNKTLSSPVLSGTVSGAGTIPTAVLADDAVTLAKMAAGTAGNLITYDASGNPAAVATGTSGQVLTSNGAGAAPTMQSLSSTRYVRFAGSTASISNQLGVSSVVRSTTGTWVITFTTLANAIITLSAQTTAVVSPSFKITAQTSTTVTVEARDNAGGLFDPDQVHINIIG